MVSAAWIRIGIDRNRRNILVVRRDGVADDVVFAVFCGELGPELGMGAFGFPVNGFSDIMQQTGAKGDFWVEPQFRSHEPGEQRHLLAVLQHVLSVGRPVFQPAEQFDELRFYSVDVQFEDDFLGGLLHFLFKFLFAFFNKLFYAAGMYPCRR